MGKTWLIVNSASGSYDPEAVEAIRAALAEAGAPVDRLICVPEDDLPDAPAVRTADPALIAIYTGDGTLNALVNALDCGNDCWTGRLLVLPGGTMNLLSHKLHGEAQAQGIVRAALDEGAGTRRLSMAQGAGKRSLVGIIAGPTTAWGEVREDLRKVDFAGLAHSVPEALSRTLGGETVSIEDVDGAYQAIFIEPQEEALTATGIKAANIADLAQHGFAWLTRDFLGGPSEPLARAASLTVVGSGRIGLLVDGERAEGESPCTFSLVSCNLNFIATKRHNQCPKSPK